MKFVHRLGALALSFALPISVIAQPALIGCGKNGDLAKLEMTGFVSTSPDGCPLLDDKEIYKVVEKFAVGTLFAWRLGIPNTCFSGSVGGTLTYNGIISNVSGEAQSAQRIFPVSANDVPATPGLFAVSTDGTLSAGAALTALRLSIDNKEAIILSDDRFLSNQFGRDAEDFLIIGSSGDLRFNGRLSGSAQLIPDFPNEGDLSISFDDISGSVCVKDK